MTIDHDHERLPDVVDSSEPPAEPIANPGLPAHVWRPTDVDPKAEKRAERQVAFMFFLSTVCAVLFVVRVLHARHRRGPRRRSSGSARPTSPSA